MKLKSKVREVVHGFCMQNIIKDDYFLLRNRFREPDKDFTQPNLRVRIHTKGLRLIKIKGESETS